MARSAAKTCRWCRRRPRRRRHGACASPQAEARRDYELALQIGNKGALNAFLAQYPEGFYASLAKLQLEKFAAEEARVAATEKARLAEQERARLAAEGAQKGQQAKADADAKAAEQARIAAEKAKQVAQDQAAEAERKRAATESVAPTSAAGCRQGRRPRRRLAALTPGRRSRLTKSVQAELRRVGCLTAAPTANGTRRRSARWRCSTACRNQIRRQAGQPRCARRDQAEIVAGLPAGLRARLQGRRRPLQQDLLRGGFVPQRRQ